MTPSAMVPPGRYGLPVLGPLLGTLEFFLFGWERYFTARRRRHGTTVFKVNLFRPTIAVLDTAGIAALFGDADLIQDYGFSWAKPPLELVGGVVPSIFEHGALHDSPKAFYLEWLAQRTPDLPAALAAVMDEFLARWTSHPAFAWGDEIEDLAMTFVFTWLLGAPPPLEETRYLYNNIFLHPAPWLTRLFRNSAYSRSLRAYRKLVDFIPTAPRFAEVAALAKRHGLTEEALPHRLAFLLGMNGFLGTQSVMKSVVGELSGEPGLQDRLRLALADGARAPTDATLDGVVREVLRLHPPVYFIFGRAIRDRTLESASGAFAIKAGELVMGVLPIAQRDPALFPNPDRFDPDRYRQGRAQGPLIWARGPHDAAVTRTDRTCPGKDPGILAARLFAARLATGYRWQLDAPPKWTHSHYGLNVAAPEGQLGVSQFRRDP